MDGFWMLGCDIQEIFIGAQNSGCGGIIQ